MIDRLYLLDGEVLLGNLDLGGAHVVAGVAHDVGVLIHQEDVLGLDAGLSIGIAGAVPVGAGGELGVGVGDVLDLVQLADAGDHVVGVLRQAGGHGVAVGVGPGAEAALAALLANRALNGGQDLLEVAVGVGQVDAQSARIAHQRGGQVGLDTARSTPGSSPE